MLTMMFVLSAFARTTQLPDCAFTEAGCYEQTTIDPNVGIDDGGYYEWCESACYGARRSCEDWSYGEAYWCMDDVNAVCNYERDHGSGEVCADGDWSIYDECWTEQSEDYQACQDDYVTCEAACR